MDPEKEQRSTPDDQRTAFTASSADRDRTLEALRELEAAIGMAAPGREAEWLGTVRTRLRSLEEAVVKERDESLRPDGLLSMVGRDYPRRLGSRIRQLRDEHDDIVRRLESLRVQIDRHEAGDTVDVPDLRQRLSWAIQAIRHRRARETDLVYEAITLDLGESDV